MNASTVVRYLVALPLLVGCGGKTTTTTPAPALDVNPRISTVLVGGAPVALAATLTNSTAAIQWTMTPAVGALSATTGASITYTPPTTVAEVTPVVITAAADGAMANAVVTVKPVGGTAALAIDPVAAEATAGSDAVNLAATLTGATDVIHWALAPAVGSLTADMGAAVGYTPPATLDAETTVVVTATAGTATAHAVVVVHPNPSLSVFPTTAAVQAGGSPIAFAATLLGGTDTISWRLDPAVGSLSATTGASVTWTPPATLATGTQVTITASADGLTAEATIDVSPATVAPVAGVTIDPVTATVAGSGAPISLTATLQNVTGTITWSVGPALGALSATTGASVQYTPPATVPAATDVTVYATVEGVTGQAVVTVTPAPTLQVAVDSATIDPTTVATLTATLTGSTDTITWAMQDKTGIGARLSATTGTTVTVTPPAQVGLQSPVIVTAAAAGLTVSTTITVQATVTDKKPPLSNQRFITLNKVVEYMVLGLQTSESSQDNEFIIDPYLAYGEIDDQPISLAPDVKVPTKARLYETRNTDFTATTRKVAKAGNLDDDFPDETVVLTWTPQVWGSPALATGSDAMRATVAKMTILDASLPDLGGAPVIDVVIPPVDLTILVDHPATDYSLAVGDIDGDGYDEIVVVGTLQWDVVSESAILYGKMWVFDDALHNYQLMSATPIQLKGDNNSSGVAQGLSTARVAIGSMKGDGSVQIVVGWYDNPRFRQGLVSNGSDYLKYGIGAISYAIYDGMTLTQIGGNHQTGTLQDVQYDWTLSNFAKFDLALADVDGDQKKELIVAGWDSGWWHTNSQPNSWNLIEIRDDLDAAAGPAFELPKLFSGQGTHEDVSVQVRLYPTNFVVPLDFDYNGKDKIQEFLVGPYLYKYVAPATAGGTGTIAEQTTLRPVDKWTYHYNIADLQAGDVNGDMRQDIVMLYKNGQIVAKGLRDHLDTVSGYPLQKHYKATPDFVTLDTSTISAPACEFTSAPCQNAILVPVNVDNDSMILEYAGKASAASRARTHTVTQRELTLTGHSIHYGDNKIIALLAAPPLTADPGQDTNNSDTTFGTSSGSSVTAGYTFGTHAGVTVGYEFELSAGLGVSVQTFKAEFEVSMQLEYNHETSYTTTITQEYSFAAHDGDDLVVFSATPYDRFTYLVSASPTERLAGSTFDVNVPQGTSVMAVSRAAYNDEFAGGLLITPDLMQANPFDTTSYPAKADVPPGPVNRRVGIGNGLVVDSTILPVYGNGVPICGPANVAIGNTSTGCSVSIDKSTAWQDGIDFTLDFSAKIAVMGVSVGMNSGFSVGGYLGRSVDSGISFGGDVYGLPQGSTFDRYSWGLFPYKQVLLDPQGKVMQSFFVINYWVGPYGDSTPPVIN